MIFHPNPAFSTRMVRAGFTGDPTHPLGLSLENYLDLYFQIHSFSFSLSSLNLNPFGFIGSISNLTEGLIELEAMNNSNNDVISVSGTITRKSFFIGNLNDDGTELLNSRSPTTSLDYPIFSGGFGGALVNINLGKTFFNGALYYPEITIVFSNGMASNASGNAAGFVSFGQFGQITVYTGTLLFGFVSGAITPKEHYSELVCTPERTAVGSRVIVKCANGASALLNTIDEVYLNGAKCEFVKTAIDNVNYQLEIVIPPRAKTDQLIFIKKSPQNIFKSPFVVIVD